jgi:histone H3/H4
MLTIMPLRQMIIQKKSHMRHSIRRHPVHRMAREIMREYMMRGIKRTAIKPVIRVMLPITPLNNSQ